MKLFLADVEGDTAVVRAEGLNAAIEIIQAEYPDTEFRMWELNPDGPQAMIVHLTYDR